MTSNTNWWHHSWISWTEILLCEFTSGFLNFCIELKSKFMANCTQVRLCITYLYFPVIVGSFDLSTGTAICDALVSYLWDRQPPLSNPLVMHTRNPRLFLPVSAVQPPIAFWCGSSILVRETAIILLQILWSMFGNLSCSIIWTLLSILFFLGQFSHMIKC